MKKDTSKWKKIKMWVVMHAKINKPYNEEWNAYITLNMDIQEYGKTIEEAYCNLTERIYDSNYLSNLIKQ